MSSSESSAAPIMEDAFASAARDFSGPLRLPPPPAPPEIVPVAVPTPSVPGVEVPPPSPHHSQQQQQQQPLQSQQPPPPPPPPQQQQQSQVQQQAPPGPPPTLTSPGPKSKGDMLVLGQVTRSQLQTVRAQAHRAAHDMEVQRVSVGSRQITELFIYFTTFLDCVQRSIKANDRCLAFIRATSAATATWCKELAAAGASLDSVTSGEVMRVPCSPSVAAPASATASASAAATAPGGPSSILSPTSHSPPSTSFTLSTLSAAVQDVQGQLQTMGNELASAVSRMLAGDADGPLGKHSSSRKSGSAAAAASGSSPPGDCAGLAAWYAAAAADLKERGSASGAALTEVQGCCERAYGELEALISAHLSGDPKRIAGVKGKCAWVAELKYRRACRALLGVKARYLATMAALFERFRGVEQARSEALGGVMDAYAALIQRSFEKVRLNRVPEAAKALATHADLCRVVDAEARARIMELRTTTGTLQQQQHHLEQRHAQQQQPINFRLDPSPAVISPFTSPLVMRCGNLLRQSSIIKVWKPVIGVLTRDGHLHMFSPEDDMGTHPAVVRAFFRDGVAAGFGGANREVYSVLAKGSGGSSSSSEGGGVASSTPTPAFPAPFIAYASDMGARVDDMATGASGGIEEGGGGGGGGSPSSSSSSSKQAAAAAGLDPVSLARKAGSVAKHTFVLTPSTKIKFPPLLHPAAFELLEERGFFGGGNTRATLRATSEADMLDWVMAINTCLDTVVPVLHG